VKSHVSSSALLQRRFSQKSFFVKRLLLLLLSFATLLHAEGDFSAEQKLWILAAAAPLTEFNGGCHTMLGGFPRNPKEQGAFRSGLGTSWGVHDRDELLTELARLDQGGGHRALFHRLQGMSADDLATQMKQPNADTLLPFRWTLAQRYKRSIKHLVAWDMCRYLNLCNKAYFVGWLEAEEAWLLMAGAARKIQATYTSWHAVGEDYLLGRLFWDAREMGRSGDQFTQVIARLKHLPGSPWLTCPWDLPLSDKAKPKE
jgi:hypothetical protein